MRGTANTGAFVGIPGIPEEAIVLLLVGVLLAGGVVGDEAGPDDAPGAPMNPGFEGMGSAVEVEIAAGPNPVIVPDP